MRVFCGARAYPWPWRDSVHFPSAACRRPRLPSRGPDVVHRGHDLPENIEGVGIAHVAQAEDRLVEAHLGQLAETIHSLLRRHAPFPAVAGDEQAVEAGLLDLLVGPAFGLAVALEHLQLVAQR